MIQFEKNLSINCRFNVSQIEIKYIVSRQKGINFVNNF